MSDKILVDVFWLSRAITALKYLSENDKPYSGESPFNSADIDYIARKLENTMETPKLKGLVVPEQATNKNMSTLCSYQGRDQEDFARGWNDCLHWTQTYGVTPPITKGISPLCEGWNTCVNRILDLQV